ncbi:low density lipoprotein receptor adapter protein 1 isoform 2-T7 [Syngnathus typhle]
MEMGGGSERDTDSDRTPACLPAERRGEDRRPVAPAAMDALKNAGRAIIKSPGVPRHTWGTSKHEKLPENWTDTKETLLEGMAFNLKYLGMTLVGQPKGEDMAAAAIRRIVTTARAGAKKFRKVTLTVSPKGIVITDTDTADLVENVSIYRISYCTADKSQDKVFAYVSQSAFNETLECHAFLCQKKKIAQAVTLTVAQAFKVALDLWELAQQGHLNGRLAGPPSLKIIPVCLLSSLQIKAGRREAHVAPAQPPPTVTGRRRQTLAAFPQRRSLQTRLAAPTRCRVDRSCPPPSARRRLAATPLGGDPSNTTPGTWTTDWMTFWQAWT